MSLFLFILTFVTVLAFLVAGANAQYKDDLKKKKNGTYLPADFYMEDAGLAPESKNYKKWKKKEIEIERRRRFWEEKEKELKRKGQKPWWK